MPSVALLVDDWDIIEQALHLCAPLAFVGLHLLGELAMHDYRHEHCDGGKHYGER